jgi:hypothetical protein
VTFFSGQTFENNWKEGAHTHERFFGFKTKTCFVYFPGRARQIQTAKMRIQKG